MLPRVRHAPPWRWLLPCALLAATASGTLATFAWANGQADVASASGARPMYHIVPLSDDPFAFNADINARGEVSFTELFAQPEPGVERARFWDGKTVRTLGTFGGSTSWAFALNDRGQVTGFAETGGLISHAYRWSKATGLVDLTNQGKTGTSVGIDINNKGEVVGTAVFRGFDVDHAARWNAHNVAQDLGTLNGGRSLAAATNDAGVVVGWSDATPSPQRLPFRWTQRTGMQPLPGAFPSDSAEAADVNQAGWIAGTAAVRLNGPEHAFLWTPQHGFIDLGTGSGTSSSASRLNDKGTVIGFINNLPAYFHGFAWTRNSGLIEIGANNVNTVANGLNNRDQVVGSAADRAFLWTRAGGLVDLNSLLCDVPGGFVLRQASVINDRGDIVVNTNTGLVLLTSQQIFNLPPLLGPVIVTGTEQAGNTLTFTVNFTDVDVRDTHTAVWDWGDGTTERGTVNEKNGRGSVTAQHTYSEGEFRVTLTITDSTGKSATVRRDLDIRPAPGTVSQASPSSTTAPARRMAPPGRGQP